MNFVELINKNNVMVREDTLADQLNHAMADIAGHRGIQKEGLKWFQFGNVAVLRILPKEEAHDAFSCMLIGGEFDIAYYPDVKPDEIKNKISSGEGAGEGIYSQYDNAYDAVIYVLRQLGAEAPALEEESDEDFF